MRNEKTDRWIAEKADVEYIDNQIGTCITKCKLDFKCDDKHNCPDFVGSFVYRLKITLEIMMKAIDNLNLAKNDYQIINDGDGTHITYNDGESVYFDVGMREYQTYDEARYACLKYISENGD